MAYSKGNYDGENGVHGVPTWRIAGYALNDLSTNLYMVMMSYIAYYLTGFVGFSVVLAGSFSMLMRIWDGVTDPIIGLVLDKTNGKFGKNRPFLVVGNLILFITSFIMFTVTPMIPRGFGRILFFILISAVYYIGYTCQCIVTKSGQSALTNDPKQRPLFALFAGLYNTLMFTLSALYVTGYLIGKYGEFTSAGLFKEMQLTLGIISFILMIIVVISIAPKDIPKYFGVGGGGQKIGLKDYADVLAHNRAIQMLVLSASTDKLGGTVVTGAVQTVLYGVICGNIALAGIVSGYTAIPNFLFLLFGVGYIATRLGQKQALLVGSWGTIICNILLIALFYFSDPRSLSLPGAEGFSGITFFTVAFLILYISSRGLQMVAGSIVVPMTADCADYETARSGKYVPGLMGTLFSFVDKIVSSLAPFIANIMFAMIGFTTVMPDVGTPETPALKAVGIFLNFGLILIGSVVNIIAMHFYPLNKEKMEEVQKQIAEIKAKAETQTA